MLMDATLCQKLRDMVSGKVLFDEPMSRHTSIGVGGNADAAGSFIFCGSSKYRLFLSATERI